MAPQDTVGPKGLHKQLNNLAVELATSLKGIDASGSLASDEETLLYP